MEKHIFDTDVLEYRTGPAKFGICMATYQRKNGKSPFYLKRSLDAILNQTATNWHLYLVGDKYENNDEFLACIASFPKDRITYVNLSSAQERENVVDRRNLWMVGGCNAMNTSHKMALDDDCTYMVHHDDDDYFSSKKIQLLNYVLTLHPDPICIFHYTKHMGGRLPAQEFTEIHSSLNNLYYLPLQCNVNHSALTIHKSVASAFQYSGFYPGKVRYECGDMQLIHHIRTTATNDPTKYTVFIPCLLCIHDVEGESTQ
jgi:glycosyltransferase involved in cell wall biosynthesis